MKIVYYRSDRCAAARYTNSALFISICHVKLVIGILGEPAYITKAIFCITIAHEFFCSALTVKHCIRALVFAKPLEIYTALTRNYS